MAEVSVRRRGTGDPEATWEPDAKKRGVPARAPRVWVFVETTRQRPAPAASICFWILSRLNDPGDWLGG